MAPLSRYPKNATKFPVEGKYIFYQMRIFSFSIFSVLNFILYTLCLILHQLTKSHVICCNRLAAWLGTRRNTILNNNWIIFSSSIFYFFLLHHTYTLCPAYLNVIENKFRIELIAFLAHHGAYTEHWVMEGIDFLRSFIFRSLIPVKKILCAWQGREADSFGRSEGWNISEYNLSNCICSLAGVGVSWLDLGWARKTCNKNYSIRFYSTDSFWSYQHLTWINNCIQRISIFIIEFIS